MDSSRAGRSNKVLPAPFAIVYTLHGFSSEEAAFVAACARHPRGWLSAGVRVVDANTVPLLPEKTEAPPSSGIKRRRRSPSPHASRRGRSPRSDDLAGVKHAVHCNLFLTPASEMRVLYPQTYLRGLSVTDRRASPIQVHINADNWARVPADSDYADLAAYREHLLNHEWGHVLGFGHADPPRAKPAAPASPAFEAHRTSGSSSSHSLMDDDVLLPPSRVCDVMQQPSKSLGGARASPYVDGGSAAPADARSIARRLTLASR